MHRATMYLSLIIVVIRIALADDSASITTPHTTFDDHPIVGSWMLDFAPEDPDNALAPAVFAADGTYMEIDTDRRGAWEPTGDTTAALFISQVQEEDTMMFHARIEVDPDGQSWTATYIVEFFTPPGEFTIGSGVLEGTRMNATPVATPTS
jgi:hypothetical protein